MVADHRLSSSRRRLVRSVHHYPSVAAWSRVAQSSVRQPAAPAGVMVPLMAASMARLAAALPDVEELLPAGRSALLMEAE